MKIAYLVNQYPGISHTFVRREILALEKLGMSVARFAIRSSRQGLISEEDKSEAALTRRVVGAPALDLIGSILASLLRSPLGALTAFAAAIQFGRKSEAGLFRHGLYFLEALVLAHWLRRAGVNHVHAHFGTNSTTVALLASRITGGSFSFTAHGPEEFDKPGPIGLKEKIEEAAFTVAISSFGMSQLRRLVTPDHWSKIKIVHCGIENAFHEGAVAPLPQAKRFVCVGRLCEQKGQVTLIEAAARLKRDGYAFELVLVGDGEMRPLIEKAVRDHNLSGEVVFAGWKTPTEVRAEIEASRAFVLPSYAEGLPVSIMEAFMLNRPVISTYIAGIPELVEPGVNGWLAPAGDAEALAVAMAEALTADDAVLSEMGRHGKEKTAERHEIDTEAAKLKLAFQAVLDAPS